MKINRIQLRKILRESAIAPNAAGPIQIMMGVGDERYLMQRASEFVTLAINSPTSEQQSLYLQQAITLLGITRHEVKKSCNEKPKTVVTKFTSGGGEVRQDI